MYNKCSMGNQHKESIQGRALELVHVEVCAGKNTTIFLGKAFLLLVDLNKITSLLS
jgi:hypothetical protein